MVTVIADDLVSISKIEAAAKQLGVAVIILSLKDALDFTDDFYIIDFNSPHGLETAQQVKKSKPNAKITGFYPHVRSDIKESVEHMGCKAFTNGEFFLKTKDILARKI